MRTILYKPKFNFIIETSNVILRESSPVDTFYSCDVHADGVCACAHVDPIIMLFNEERLKRTIGIEQVENWIKSLSPKDSALAELRAKCTDEELSALVKSRHIQNPSELWRYAQALSYSEENLQSEVQKALAEEAAKEAEAKAKSETSVQNDSTSSME